MNPFLRVTRVTVVFAAAASAGIAQGHSVSQWDPTLGGFELLGCIDTYPTALSAADYYGFDGANPNLPPGAPTTLGNRSHVFLVDSAVDGLCLFFIHDDEADSAGGRAETSWTITGDPNGADWLAQDGPPTFDTYTGGPGGSVFTAIHNWPAVNSDGAAIGGLDGVSTVEGVFTDLGGATGDEFENVTSWVAYSSAGSTLELVLEVDRPLRIDAACFDAWVDEGFALAGALGPPSLDGNGTLLPGDVIRLDLADALPSSTAFLVVGLSQLGAPFKGGVLVPAVDLTLPLPTGLAGAFSLATLWPSGVPGGVTFTFQCWIQDAAGPAGFAASNAVSTTTP